MTAGAQSGLGCPPIGIFRVFGIGSALDLPQLAAESTHHPLISRTLYFHARAGRDHAFAAIWDFRRIPPSSSVLVVRPRGSAWYHQRPSLRRPSPGTRCITLPFYKTEHLAPNQRCIITSGNARHSVPTSTHSDPLTLTTLTPSKNDVLPWTVSNPLVRRRCFRRDMVPPITRSRRIPWVGPLREPQDRGMEG
jgi:hypothetical protein